MENSEKLTTLITGAGIGIGAATARAFADAGYRVIVTYWKRKGDLSPAASNPRVARPSSVTLTSRTPARSTQWYPTFRIGTVRCTRS